MTQPLQVIATAFLMASLAGCLNFHVVEDGKVYRSAQPSRAQLAGIIEEQGIKTVLFLRKSDPGDLSFEISYQTTIDAGAAFIRYPLSAHRYPSQKQLLDLWKIFATAEYPLLLHCRGGADRAGLASAVYILQAHGDVDAACEQLAFWPYRHTGLLGSFKLGHIFELYRPYAEQISFPRWVRDHYNPLDHDFQIEALRAQDLR